MKTIVFSTLHIRDQAHAAELKPELMDWYHRVHAAIDADYIYLVESGYENRAPATIPTVCAKIPHTKPYDCKNWSYFQANMSFALQFIHLKWHKYDLAVMIQHDAILGVPLQPVLDEFAARPEVIAAPRWNGSPDTHCLIMKPEAVIDVLYSLPFIPFPRVGGHNQLWVEHAYGALFLDRWWNPWPSTSTIRHEYGTPEQVQTPDDEITRWPMLAKTSPALAERYRNERKIT